MPPLPSAAPWVHPLAVTARFQLDSARETLDDVQSRLVSAARAADWQSAGADAFHERIRAMRSSLDDHSRLVHDLAEALGAAMTAMAAATSGQGGGTR
jgi:uncharacterized protein YukE